MTSFAAVRGSSRSASSHHFLCRAAALSLTVLVVVACGAGAATQPGVGTARHVPDDCTNSSPCQLAPGTYDTGTFANAFIAGMTLTLSRVWLSHSLNALEFSLYPPDHPDDRLFFWEDMVVVKSSGPGHGTTVLTDVGTSPSAVASSLASNPDVLVIAKPAPVTGVAGLPAMRLVVGVSQTAQYGDTACPANPRCADLFARLDNMSEYFSIGGPEEVRIDISAIELDGRAHTLFVAIDAPDGEAELERFSTEAEKVIDSVRMPADVASG